mmetsp:Transcript_13926/g.41481  ORF Transcript_13926/g.41481 Transcript_13926/m.41481 type:complete len:271 (-) Transcript_13926:237-1049(-)
MPAGFVAALVEVGHGLVRGARLLLVVGHARGLALGAGVHGFRRVDARGRVDARLVLLLPVQGPRVVLVLGHPPTFLLHLGRRELVRVHLQQGLGGHVAPQHATPQIRVLLEVEAELAELGDVVLLVVGRGQVWPPHVHGPLHGLRGRPVRRVAGRRALAEQIAELLARLVARRLAEVGHLEGAAGRRLRLDDGRGGRLGRGRRGHARLGGEVLPLADEGLGRGGDARVLVLPKLRDERAALELVEDGHRHGRLGERREDVARGLGVRGFL